MDSITELPNIGNTMKARLAAVDINSSNELRELGSKAAFAKLRLHEGDTCFSSLCALEGAILGIRWHYLSEETKNELKEFYDSFNE